MADNPPKIVSALALLLSVWIVSYWLYHPSEPRISFSEPGGGGVGGESSPIRSPALSVTSSTRVAAPITSAAPSQGASDAVPEAPRSARAAAPPAQVMEAPRFTIYTVQPGDRTFDSIARRLNAANPSGRLTGEILSRANPLVTPNRLIPGKTRLRIPEDPQNIQGRIVSVGPDGVPDSPNARRPAPFSPAGAQPMPQSPSTAPPTPTKVTEYTVRPGDTLSGIAKAVYTRSTPALWDLIARANGLDDAKALRPGVKLRIPPEPADD